MDARVVAPVLLRLPASSVAELSGLLSEDLDRAAFKDAWKNVLKQNYPDSYRESSLSERSILTKEDEMRDRLGRLSETEQTRICTLQLSEPLEELLASPGLEQKLSLAAPSLEAEAVKSLGSMLRCGFGREREDEGLRLYEASLATAQVLLRAPPRLFRWRLSEDVEVCGRVDGLRFDPATQSVQIIEHKQRTRGHRGLCERDKVQCWVYMKLVSAAYPSRKVSAVLLETFEGKQKLQPVPEDSVDAERLASRLVVKAAALKKIFSTSAPPTEETLLEWISASLDDEDQDT